MRILIEPNASLTEQYQALMDTEGLKLEFARKTPSSRIAEVAWQVNETTENIGARRLHTVLERLLEDIILPCNRSGFGSQGRMKYLQIDADYVTHDHLGELAQDEDLSRYIL